MAEAPRRSAGAGLPGEGLLLNFHPRKTGGSTVCELAIEHGMYPPEADPKNAWLYPGLAGAQKKDRWRFGHMDLPLLSGCNCQVQLRPDAAAPQASHTVVAAPPRAVAS